jgi:hypothetical protein
MNSPIFMKNESEKLPSIQSASNKQSSNEKTTNSNKCIVPVIENQGKQRTPRLNTNKFSSLLILFSN